MSVIFSNDTRYLGDEKALADGIFAIVNDEQNIKALRNIYPSYVAHKRTLPMIASLLVCSFDKEGYEANKETMKTTYESVDKQRSRTDLHNLVGEVAAGVTSKDLEAAVRKSEGGHAAWERFRAMGRNIIEEFDKADDSRLKRDLEDKIKTLRGLAP